MNEQIEKSNQEEEEELTCPECGKGFQDMRGLTSHARHMHGLDKEELSESIGENKDSVFFGTLAGVGALLLTIITLGRIR